MNRRWTIGLGALALTGSAAVAAWLWPWSRFEGGINALGVDLSRPAAYLSTPSLSALPRDLVKAPVLRELLTEDFAFYYEDHEERLGLTGALRRIAFEHETTLADNLLALALDEPSEVALWTDGKGAPRHWAVAISRSALSKALQGLAAVAAKDKQLTLIGEIKSAAWSFSAQPVYALELSTRRTLALAARGNRLVVLSDPGLLFDRERQPDRQAARVLEGLLSGDGGGQGVWRRHFGLPAEPAPQHQLVAGGTMLSFGYQSFFPALQALRIEVEPGGQSLHSFVRRTGAAPAGAAPWPALPARAAACMQLPVDWARAKAVLSDGAAATPASGASSDAAALAARRAGLAAMAEAFDGSAAICWYERSQLHTPLLVAHARGAPPSPELLSNFAKWWLPATAGPAEGSGSGTRASIAAPYGPLRAGERPGYQARLARVGDWWLFSPDAELVDQAEATLARRYPSLADTLQGPADTLALAVPAQVAELLRREALAVITPQQAAFRQAAEAQLLPRLASFGKLPAVQAVPRGTPDAQGWQPLDWRVLKAVAR